MTKTSYKEYCRNSLFTKNKELIYREILLNNPYPLFLTTLSIHAV